MLPPRAENWKIVGFLHFFAWNEGCSGSSQALEFIENPAGSQPSISVVHCQCAAFSAGGHRHLLFVLIAGCVYGLVVNIVLCSMFALFLL